MTEDVSTVCPECGVAMKSVGAPIWETWCDNNACKIGSVPLLKRDITAWHTQTEGAGTIVEGEELTAMQAITLAIMDAKPVDGFPVPRGELAAWRYGKDCALAAAREALHDWSARAEPCHSATLVARLETACARAEDEYPKLAAPDGTVAVEIADLRDLLARYELIRSRSLIV